MKLPIGLKSLLQSSGKFNAYLDDPESIEFETRNGYVARLICADAKLSTGNDLIFLVGTETGYDELVSYSSTARCLCLDSNKFAIAKDVGLVQDLDIILV